jgi:hypothetical protein
MVCTSVVTGEPVAVSFNPPSKWRAKYGVELASPIQEEMPTLEHFIEHALCQMSLLYEAPLRVNFQQQLSLTRTSHNKTA